MFGSFDWELPLYVIGGNGEPVTVTAIEFAFGRKMRVVEGHMYTPSGLSDTGPMLTNERQPLNDESALDRFVFGDAKENTFEELFGEFEELFGKFDEDALRRADAAAEARLGPDNEESFVRRMHGDLCKDKHGAPLPFDAANRNYTRLLEIAGRKANTLSPAARALLNSDASFNKPLPAGDFRHDTHRMVGWYVPIETAGLSEAIELLAEIKQAALNKEK